LQSYPTFPPQAWEYRANVSIGGDKLTHQWLKGFVADVGLETANRVLNNTGIPKGYHNVANASLWSVDPTAVVFNNRKDSRHHKVFLDFVESKKKTFLSSSNYTIKYSDIVRNA
jgi:hypothetical protein